MPTTAPLQVEAVGIDHDRRRARCRSPWPRCAPAAARPSGRSAAIIARAKHRKVAPSGSCATCTAHPPGRGERAVHHPARAGAAEPGERKAGGREPLGDIAGRIDAQEEERHPARARPLQRRQAVAGLLEADAEPRRQRLDIVAQVARRPRRTARRASAGRRRCSSAGRCGSAPPPPASWARPRPAAPPPASRASSSASWKAMWKPRLSRGSISDRIRLRAAGS